MLSSQPPLLVIVPYATEHCLFCRYGEIIASQFNTAVLQHLPEDMRALTDERQTFVPAISAQPLLLSCADE